MGQPAEYEGIQPARVDVLVVDDDAGVRTSFGTILRDAGYSVEEAEDGFVALQRLRAMRVGMVLLDVRMPVLDGLHVLDELEDPPPVVLMTAHEYDADVMARRSKVTLYIQKPVPPRDLLAAVAKALAVEDRKTDG